jgi:hypothetical protein
MTALIAGRSALAARRRPGTAGVTSGCVDTAGLYRPRAPAPATS